MKDKLNTQDVWKEIPVEERLPEQSFNIVNHGDGFKTAYFHKNAHISEQWSDNPYGNNLTFPKVWLEKQSIYCFTKEELVTILAEAQGDAYAVGLSGQSLEMAKQESVDYIKNLFK